MCSTEGYDPVRGIVADICRAEKGDARHAAPVIEHRFHFHAERPVVGRDIAEPPHADASHLADIRIGGNVTERAIDPVMIFGYVLQHQHMIREIGLEWGADNVAEHGQVKRCGGRMRFDGIGCSLDQPAQRAVHRRIAALSPDIGGHGTVRYHADLLAIKSRQQIARIAIAQPGLGPRGLVQQWQRVSCDPSRAIAAAREPDRIDYGIIRHLHQRRQPCRVTARKMPIDQPALRMEKQCWRGIAVKRRRARLHPIRHIIIDRAAWRDDSDPHAFDALHRRPLVDCLRPQ